MIRNGFRNHHNPQPDGRSYWTIALPVVGILGLAAVIVWVVVSIPSARLLLKSDLVRAGFLGTSVATDLAEQFPQTRTVEFGKAASLRRRRRNRGNLQEPRSRFRPERVHRCRPGPVVPVAPTRAPPSALNRTIPDFVTRQLDRDELASMLQRADDFIKSGDLSSARLLLRRGAEAGDARATLTLAGTFDPNVLKTLPVSRKA